MFYLFDISFALNHEILSFVISNIKSFVDYITQINHISWQITFLIFIFIFRSELKILIKNIKEIRHNGTSIAINEEQEQKEQKNIVVLTKKEADELTKQIQNNLQESEILKAHLHFERTYRLILDSQLHLLQLILNQGFLTQPLAQAIHRRTVIASNYPYQQYINFLINAQIISYNSKNGSYILTDLGRYFIKYLQNNLMTLRKTNTSDIIISPNTLN